MNKKLLIFLYSSLIIVGIIFGLFLAIPTIKFFPSLLCKGQCQNIITDQRYYFNEQVVVYSIDEKGNQQLVNLDMSRKKIGDSYTHYYYGNLSLGQFNKHDYTEFRNNNTGIESHDFLKAYSHSAAPDLSTREAYEFQYSAGPIIIEVKSEELSGDFITKNTLEFTRYLSEGAAQLMVNGKSYPARIAVIKTYSADYDKYVFFDGYDTLHSLSQVFELWDENLNFYFVDKTEVYEDIPNYKSHIWVLYKNHEGKFMRKAFDAQVSPTLEKGRPKNWVMEISELNAKFSLRPSFALTAQKDIGMVRGEVNNEGNISTISGYYSYNEYGN